MCYLDLKVRSVGTTDYERGANIRPWLLIIIIKGTSYEAFKEKELYVPETTTSLV